MLASGKKESGDQHGAAKGGYGIEMPTWVSGRLWAVDC